MKLKRADGAILSNLSVFPASITPKAVVTKLGDKAFAQNPVGSGPFVVTELDARPVPEDEPQPALLARRASRTSTASSSTTSRTTTRGSSSCSPGEADVAESIPFSQVDSLNKGSTRVEIAPLASIDAIWLNNNHKPFDDKLVRQALNYATDKDAINRVVYFGHARGRQRDLPVLRLHRQVGSRTTRTTSTRRRRCSRSRRRRRASTSRS